jgi:hypothetical protein
VPGLRDFDDLLIGVAWTIRDGMHCDPTVVLGKRELGQQFPPPAEANVRELARHLPSEYYDWRPAHVKVSESLLHLANAMAAAVLVQRAPEHALLLRQTAEPRPITNYHNTGDNQRHDAPEWHLPTPSSDDGPARWQVQGRHRPSSNDVYTSFTQPHHSVGDAVVQHLLFACSGARYNARVTLYENVRKHAARINAATLQALAQ